MVVTNQKTIDVPNFKLAKDFRNWSNSLTEEEIRSWTTDDWNKVYKNLFHYLEYSPEMYKLFLQTFENYKVAEKINKSIQPQDLNDSENLYLRTEAFLEDIENRSALGYLYLNYKPEKEQIKQIIKSARLAGKKVAQKENFDLVKIVYSSNLYAENDKEYLKKIKTMSQEEILKAAEIINKVVYSQTNFRKNLRKKRLSPKNLEAYFGFLPEDESTKKGYTTYTTGKPVVEVYGYGDEKIIETLFHEFFHAHLQRMKKISDKRFSFLNSIKPIHKFDDKYYKLLENNDKLYLKYDKDTFAQIIKDDEENLCQHEGEETYQKKYNNARRNDYKAYKCQPLEWGAFLYGMIAERSFRRETKQLSERGLYEAIGALNYINYALSTPDNVQYDKHKNIKLTWNKVEIKECHSNEETAKFLETIIECENSPLKNIVETGIEKNGEIYIKFPNENGIKECWYNWADIAIKPVTDIIDCISPSEVAEIGDMNGKQECEIIYEKSPFSSEQLNQYLSHNLSPKTLSSLDIHNEDKSLVIKIPSPQSEEYQELFSFLQSKEKGLFEELKETYKQVTKSNILLASTKDSSIR